MNILQCLFFLLIFFVNAAIAQTVKLSGTVVDSASPIRSATVSVFSDQSSPIAQAQTDSAGRFILSLNVKNNYRIEIRHSGYHLYQKVIDLNDETDLGWLCFIQTLPSWGRSW